MNQIITLIGVLAALPAVLAKPLEGAITAAAPTPTVEIVTVTIPDGFTPPAPTATGNSTANGPDDANGPDSGPWFPGYYCSGHDMPDDGFASINAAKQKVDEECSGKNIKVPARSGLIYRAMNAQIYFCNYANADVTWELFCQKGHYDFAEPNIDKTCHPGGGGWLYTDALITDHPWSVGRDPRYDSENREIDECGF